MLAGIVMCNAARGARPGWDPLAKQSVEPDTLYLLDVERELRLVPGEGGLIPGDPNRDRPWTKVVPTEGRFRTGLRCLDRGA